MCGVLAIATTTGRSLGIDDAAVARLRDTMTHRGPDGAGLWRSGHAALAHRRLVVVDPSDAAAQPMRSPDGRFTLVYNGELYNDADLRADLACAGAPPFRTSSDTETLLAAWQQWGADALARFRGMYAFAVHDARERSIVVARDPLGIKPLYWWLGRSGGGPLLVVASEIQAILAHPDVPRRPDPVGVSTYLTTIRTVLGDRTMFESVRAVRPGQALRFDLASESIIVEKFTPAARAPRPAIVPADEAAVLVRNAVEDSVRRHLRADVPLCCLLSGGLDSTIVATIAQRRLGDLFTYCSGSPLSPQFEESPWRPSVLSPDDFSSARLAASLLRTRHAEAPVTRELFRERWPAMVAAQGVPLSTPNEVAINEVARRLRADGMIVTLSGEGADELFAGYDAPMSEALRFEEALSGCSGLRTQDAGPRTPLSARARFQLDSNAWVPIAAKPGLLTPRIWKALEGDHALIETCEREFEAAWNDGPLDDPLQAHLRFHRRVNLVGLLQRLDTATMLAGVEGRTPFADIEVAALAEALPMHSKYKWEAPRDRAALPPEPSTKRVLRDAFASDLPREIVNRPKASFPLPFQDWLGDHATALTTSPFLREWFNAAPLAAVVADPARHWQLAWPLINAALWARRWWS